MEYKGTSSKHSYRSYLKFIGRIQNNEWKNYDFTNSVYINNKTKLEVSCRFHGDFLISPRSLKSDHGCLKCGKLKRTKTTVRYQKQLEESFPDYEALEDYSGALFSIIHKHKTCGYEWEARPNSILNGTGCPVCGRIKAKNKTTKTTVRYQKQLEESFPDYEVLGAYINNYTKILHKHKTCGYEWEAIPSGITQGSGCPKCAKKGFDPTKPAILYYLSVKQGEAYKIGITNLSVHERYTNEELLDITLLKEWYFDIGQEAYDMEQSILKQYKEFKYKGKRLLKSGSTEMFFLDVLDLVSTTA